MTSQPSVRGAPEIPREFQFKRRDFDYLRRLVTSHTGIVLSENKYDMLYARLVRRIRQLGLASFAQYVDLIRSGQEGEFIQLVNAITTNLTAFFREPHHFDYLRDQVVPSVSDRGMHIWSAGCATGEEPYSIAMTLLEALPPRGQRGLRIRATDLDSNALQTARDGIYSLERLAGIGPARQRRWFLRGRGANEGLARVKPELQAPVRFSPLNLLGDWPAGPGFDAIFCRNVLIYFDKATKQRVLDRFAQALVPGGFLFLGHSESLLGVNEAFEPVGRSCYRLGAEGAGHEWG